MFNILVIMDNINIGDNKIEKVKVKREGRIDMGEIKVIMIVRNNKEEIAICIY